MPLIRHIIPDRGSRVSARPSPASGFRDQEPLVTATAKCWIRNRLPIALYLDGRNDRTGPGFFPGSGAGPRQSAPYLKYGLPCSRGGSAPSFPSRECVVQRSVATGQGMKLRGSIVGQGSADRTNLAGSPANHVFGLGGIGNALEQGMTHSKRKSAKSKPPRQAKIRWISQAKLSLCQNFDSRVKGSKANSGRALRCAERVASMVLGLPAP